MNRYGNSSRSLGSRVRATTGCAWVLAVFAAALLLRPSPVLAQAEQTIRLPKPDTEGGLPLMQALNRRRSLRAFKPDPLPDQVLSNLLWAAFGRNRPDGRRTAPSAVNWQEIDIYVALEKGLYLFDAGNHSLKLVLAEDIRAITGLQGFTQQAPVNLIYASDHRRMGRANPEHKEFYSATDTGFISQNVYLFAASEGLATVVLGMVNRDALAEKMGLAPEQKIILTQPVGYPPED